MKIGNKEFEVKGKTYIMGILNATPDSFSDGGKYEDMDAAFKHAEKMISEGAAIIDIGGESTRPGHEKISEEEEIERVCPVIEGIKKRFDIPVSIDTYKSKVARQAVKSGADLINDIWGLKYDADMAETIAESNLPCCFMHNRNQSEYKNFIKEVIADLSETIRLAEAAGIKEEKIIIDPGVGFGKTYEMNLEILNKLDYLHMFGYPLLVGASRKSVIGLALELPVEERLEGTIATSVIAAVKGCMFVRVHDVKENYRAIKMTEAILAG